MGILKILSDFADIFRTPDDDLTLEDQVELEQVEEILRKEGNTRLLNLIDEKGAKKRERASKKIAEGQKSQTGTEQETKIEYEGR